MRNRRGSIGLYELAGLRESLCGNPPGRAARSKEEIAPIRVRGKSTRRADFGSYGQTRRLLATLDVVNIEIAGAPSPMAIASRLPLGESEMAL
jgi:hypothetical protein